MATKKPVRRGAQAPDRRRYLIAAGGVALVVTIVLIAASQRSAGEESTPAERAANAAAADATSGGGATTVASTLPGIEAVDALLAGLPTSDGVLGEPSAPVTVVEYADLLCPVCRTWEAEHLPTVLERAVRTGKAKLDLRLVAIIADGSTTGARAGYAAMQQGRLWPFSLLWLYNQGPESEDYATDAYVHAIAAGAGLDLARLDDDRGADDAGAWLQANQGAAEAAGFTGTPSFVVSGPGGTIPFVDGSVPSAEALLEAIATATGDG